MEQRRTLRGWTRAERIVVVAGVLLIADLLLLPWHHYALNLDVGNLGIHLPRFAYDRSGVQAPDAAFGVIALFGASLMVLQVVGAKVVPAVAPLARFQLVAGPAVLGLLIGKLISNDDFLGRGAWLGLLLGVGMTVGGCLVSQQVSPSGLVGGRR